MNTSLIVHDLSNRIRLSLGRADFATAHALAAQGFRELHPSGSDDTTGEVPPHHQLLWVRALRTNRTGLDHHDVLEAVYERALALGDYTTATEAAAELAVDDALAGFGRPDVPWASRAVAAARNMQTAGHGGMPGSVRFALALRAAEDLDFRRALSLVSDRQGTQCPDQEAIREACLVRWRFAARDIDSCAEAAEVNARFASLVALNPPRTWLGRHAAHEVLADMLTFGMAEPRGACSDGPDAAVGEGVAGDADAAGAAGAGAVNAIGIGADEHGVAAALERLHTDPSVDEGSRGWFFDRTTEARVLLTAGDTEGAIATARESFGMGGETGPIPPRIEISAHAVIAAAEWRAGRPEAALAALVRACETGERHAVWTPFITTDPHALRAIIDSCDPALRAEAPPMVMRAVALGAGIRDAATEE